MKQRAQGLQLEDDNAEVEDQDPSVDLVVALTRAEGGGRWIPNTEERCWDASDPEKHTELLNGPSRGECVHRARVVRLAKAAVKQDDDPVVSSFNLRSWPLSMSRPTTPSPSRWRNCSSAARTTLSWEIPRTRPECPIRSSCQTGSREPKPSVDFGNSGMPWMPQLRTRRMRSACGKNSRSFSLTMWRSPQPLTRRDWLLPSSLEIPQRSEALWAPVPAISSPLLLTEMARRAKRTPWFHDFRRRLRFEAAAKAAFGDAIRPRKIGKGWGSEIRYVLTVDVPAYDVTRKLTIRLANLAEPSLIGVEVDGPTVSPHRRGEKGLCLWRYDSSPEHQWTADEGLLALIQYARIHLFREEYWRETGGFEKGGVWAGDEAPHDDVKDDAA
jgi:hypothetical protein